MFCTVGVYLQNLFSCKHISNFFAKVAKRDTGYNMHFIGGLLCTGWSLQTGTRCDTLPWRVFGKGALHRIENNLLVAAGEGKEKGETILPMLFRVGIYFNSAVVIVKAIQFHKYTDRFRIVHFQIDTKYMTRDVIQIT